MNLTIDHFLKFLCNEHVLFILSMEKFFHHLLSILLLLINLFACIINLYLYFFFNNIDETAS